MPWTPPYLQDNSAAIAQIEALLKTGATRVEVDGQTVDLDPDVLRQQLRDLMLTDTSTAYQGRRRRPTCAQINLGGF